MVINNWINYVKVLIALLVCRCTPLDGIKPPWEHKLKTCNVRWGLGLSLQTVLDWTTGLTSFISRIMWLLCVYKYLSRLWPLHLKHKLCSCYLNCWLLFFAVLNSLCTSFVEWIKHSHFLASKLFFLASGCEFMMVIYALWICVDITTDSIVFWHAEDMLSVQYKLLNHMRKILKVPMWHQFSPFSLTLVLNFFENEPKHECVLCEGRFSLFHITLAALQWENHLLFVKTASVWEYVIVITINGLVMSILVIMGLCDSSQTVLPNRN